MAYYQVQKQLQEVEEEQVQVGQHHGWANLPEELLDIVFQRLDLWDVRQCRRVCSRWESTVLDTLTTPLLYFPTVIKSSRGGKDHFLHYANLISEPAYLDTVSSGKAYNVSIEIPSGFTQCSSAISHRGWLLLSDLELVPTKLLFYSPISRATVQLPKLLKRYHMPSIKYVTSSPRVNSPICIVLACYYTSSRSYALAFCKPRDKRWKTIRARPEQTLVNDMIFCNEDFYAIDTRGVLLQFKLRLRVPRVDEVPTRTMEDLPCMSGSTLISRYLVESSSGELVMVVRQAIDSTKRTWSIRVFKMNWETLYWETMRKFGDGEALFLAQCDSMFVSTDDYRSNCIYFFDDHDGGFWNSYRDDFGVYNMEDQTFEYVVPSEDLRKALYLRWFNPSL